MNIGFESLLITISFILPGFITTRILKVGTASVGKKQSIFEETTESLLRSVYINILIGSLLVLFFQFIFIPSRKDLFLNSIKEGFKSVSVNEPFLLVWFFIIWVTASFLLATLFGYFWDPLNSVTEQLSKSTGTLTEDPYYLIRMSASQKRKENNNTQLWVRSRMTDGSQYQGEFVFGGYRSEGSTRELLLSEAIYYQAGHIKPSEKLDFVLVDTANCKSVEFIIVQP